MLAELAQITNASPLHDAAPDYIAATLGEWHGIRRASAWDSFPVLAIFLVAPLGEWLLLRRHGYA